MLNRFPMPITIIRAMESPLIWSSKITLPLHALLPTGSKEREVFGVGSIPVAILPSCQDMKIIA